MSTFLLISIIIGVSLQNIVKKAYNVKVGGGVFIFSGLSSAFAALFFILSSIGTFEFNAEFLPYSVGFSVFYSMGVAFSVLAILTGPLSLTSLITSYSLVIPAVYGIAMLGEDISKTLVIGIILLMISLFFVNMEKKDDKKITLKWGIYVFLAFLGNGGCSTVQKVQQVDLSGAYKNEFMIIALLITTATMLIVAAISERDKFGISIKKGFFWYAVCGIANGIVNLMVMMLTTNYNMPASVMFPLISAGGIILTVAVSMTLYKEKLTKNQIFGVILGIGAIVLLNL